MQFDSEESLSLLINIFDNSPAGIVISTLQEGRIINCNPNFTEMMRYSSKEEIIGKTSLELNFYPNPADRIEVVRHLREFGALKNYENTMLTKTGELIWVLSSITRITINNTQAIVSVIINITERKKAEEELLKIQAAWDSSTDNIFIIDRATLLFTNFNQSAINNLGYSVAELLQMGPQDIKPLISTEKLSVIFDEIIHSEKKSGKIETIHRRKDGTDFDAEVFIKSFCFGNTQLLMAVARDISEHKIAIAQLEKSRQELADYKFALDESSIVAITDQKGIITYANENFCKLSKYSSEELIGQDHRIINSGYHSKEFMHYLWTSIANGKPWKGELRNKAKDGTFYWVDTFIYPFLDDKGKPYKYLAIRKDITQRKMQQELLLSNAENMVKLNKELLNDSVKLNKQIIESSDQMFYVIKIEEPGSLNNPLTFVSHQCFHYFGLSTSNLLENSEIWIHAIHPDDIEQVKKTTLSLYQTYIPATRIYRIKNALSESYLWVEDYIFPLINKEGIITEIYGSIKDISNIKKYALAIEDQNKQLRDIAWTQSHLVRAPLARLIGLANLLNYENQVDEETNQLLKYILSSAQELDGVVKSIVLNSWETQEV